MARELELQKTKGKKTGDADEDGELRIHFSVFHPFRKSDSFFSILCMMSNHGRNFLLQQSF